MNEKTIPSTVYKLILVVEKSVSEFFREFSFMVSFVKIIY